MKFLVPILALLLLNSCKTLSKVPFLRPGKESVETVIVVKNNVRPRLLAEMAQKRTRQPIVFVPVTGQGAYYLSLPNGDIEKISPKKLQNFLRFSHPEQVVVLGDQKGMPKLKENFGTYAVKYIHAQHYYLC